MHNDMKAEKMRLKSVFLSTRQNLRNSNDSFNNNDNVELFKHIQQTIINRRNYDWHRLNTQYLINFLFTSYMNRFNELIIEMCDLFEYKLN